ncbi:MAG TPA: hypothetical protein VFO39_13315 [Candidatus Sulfotelmatobacter sp.]|nr:hypothetical protein [Candidatus Sulfotelmatobacter sp.]
MRTLWIAPLLLFVSAAAWGQKPVPPSVRQADQAEENAQRNIPPPLNQRPMVDPAKLRKDADELATLAQGIPSEIDQTGKGILPKDLGEKLKRIEKLAKHLRSQVTQ